LEIVLVDVHLLAIQARVLLWVGLAWLAFGLWQQFDPATVAWRAALGAFLAMWLSGRLLRTVVGVINERLASELAVRQQAQEQALAAAAVAARPPAPIPARRR
jgi:hypothetical protein